MIEKIEIPLSKSWREYLSIPDDYKQYYYCDFITGKEYCYLHDGTYADHYIFNKDEAEKHKNDEDYKIHDAEFLALSVKFNYLHADRLAEGRTYAEENQIERDKWVSELDKEQKDLWSPINNRKYKNEDEHTLYVILPQPDERIVDVVYKCIQQALDSEQDGENLKWKIFNKGYIHNHSADAVRRTWLLGDENYDADVSMTVGVRDNDMSVIVRRLKMHGEYVDKPIDLPMTYAYKFNPLTEPEKFEEQTTKDMHDFAALCRRMSENKSDMI